MKQRDILIVLIALLILIGIIFIIWNFNQPKVVNDSSEPIGNPHDCLDEGLVFNENKGCCPGLRPILGCLEKDGCGICPSGSTSICSNCGNQICESWENKCSCLEDCR